jgi:hypothetical protein
VGYKQIDEIDWSHRGERPVTGTFAKYAKEVYTYKFRDSKTGNISSINATLNHQFYVINKHGYIPISDVTSNDDLLSETGEAVKLVCNDGRQSNCGIKYNTNNTPTMVYNMEVYQQHRYYVADNFSENTAILVHNICMNMSGTANIENTSERVVPAPQKFKFVSEKGSIYEYDLRAKVLIRSFHDETVSADYGGASQYTTQNSKIFFISPELADDVDSTLFGKDALYEWVTTDVRMKMERRLYWHIVEEGDNAPEIIDGRITRVPKLGYLPFDYTPNERHLGHPIITILDPVVE